ncbi:MAG: hypothetical protein V7754_10925 [Halioglobus sp.]
MMRRRHPVLCRLLLLAFILPGLAVQAATVADLQRADKLQVRSWLTPAQNIVPGQQVKLTLEIATDRWFTGGTRLQIPEVPGVVILQTDSFASNSSEQRLGQSWVVQRWSLEIYPQRAGDFNLPGISARVKISGEDGATVEGELQGPALQFAAARPDTLARAQHWVAAPDYEVSQTFDRSLEDLQVGDAIEREILFQASEVMAMMLPAFKEEAIAGLSAYPSPPTLANNSNRGTTVATRREHISYIIEAEGEYQLPARDYFWWDTRTGEVQLLSLPTVDIRAGSTPTAAEEESAGIAINKRMIAIAVGGLLLLALLLWLASKLPIKAVTQFCRTSIKKLQERWNTLRQPALPAKLNPGNSAAD